MDNITRNAVTRRTFLGGALAAGGLLVAGCGSGGGGGGGTGAGSGAASQSGTTSGAPSSMAASSASGGGNSGVILRSALPNDFLPSATLRYNPSNRGLRRTVFDILLDRKQDGSYAPQLAKSWEWNAAGTSLVLTLQEGVTYHSGRDFGPDDVVYTLKTAMAADSGVQVAPMLNRATEVKATGTNQVTVTFDKPFASYLDALAMIPIVDSETFANIGDGRKVIGTGPFTWTSWTPGSKVVMGRNDSYWQQGKPYLGGIEFDIITQSQAMLAALQSGDIDLGYQILARDAATLKKNPDFVVSSTVGVDIYVGCSTQDKPLDDIRVRQAIAYCIDRKRITDQVYNGFAEASCVLWDSDTPGVTSDMIDHYTYDIDKAKGLLSDAGVLGTELEFAPSPQDPAFAAAADIVQYGLEQAGLKVKRVSITAADWPKRNQSYNLPALWISSVGLSASGPVPTMMSSNPLTAEANTSHFTTTEYTKLTDAVLDASASGSEKALADLTNYMLEQAFHNTMVQATTPIVAVKGLTDVATDTTQSLTLTETKLSK